MSKHHSRDIEAVKRALRKVANQTPTSVSASDIEEDILDQLVIEGWRAPDRIREVPWQEAVAGKLWVKDPLNEKRRVQIARAVIAEWSGGNLRIHLQDRSHQTVLSRTVALERMAEWMVKVLDE